jgi:NAD(P)-dependent dehydrogenase (short-subunit alcohol dehydrogenase family)
MLNARGGDRLEAAVTEFSTTYGTSRVHGLAGDVSDPAFIHDLIERTVHHFHRLDILVNNAGITGKGALGELNLEKQQQIIDVNLMGSVHCTQYALPHLRATQGRIMFISSLAGLHGLPGYSMYSMSKMALTALAESLRNEVRRSGVRVGIAYVGFTENEAVKTQLDASGEIIPLEKRSVPGIASRYKTARKILKQIARGRFKQVHSPLGILLYGLNRVSPGLVNWILARQNSA